VNVRFLLATLLLPLHLMAAQTAVVVRHAEKASETERDPMLSAIGQARAVALDSVLAGAPIAAIVVTPYQRTRETAAVVARRHGLTPIEVPVSGGVSAHARAVAAEVARHDGTVLVVGHSNTVGAIVAALGGTSDVGDLCDSEYQTVFTVLPGGGTVRSRFGAGNPAHLPACGTMHSP
jgi:broad specificity phosphatase PhoE